MEVIEEAGRYNPATSGEPNHWAEHLASADLSVGTYSVPAGGLDDQEPHREDEIYVVRAGAATLVTDSGTAQVRPGSVIFVPAGEEHPNAAAPSRRVRVPRPGRPGSLAALVPRRTECARPGPEAGRAGENRQAGAETTS